MARNKYGDKPGWFPKPKKQAQTVCNLDGNSYGMTTKVSGGYASCNIYSKPMLIGGRSMRELPRNKLFDGRGKKYK